MSPLFLILLVIGVAIGLLIVAHAQAEKRREALIAWAFPHGLDFQAVHAKGFGDRYPHFECLNKGHSRYADNVMQGRIDDYRVCAFDYHYETGGGKDSQRYHFSAVIVTTNLPLNPLFIRHETIFDRLAATVGFEGIQFESAAFNREFHVSSPDHRWAFDVLPQATMEFLMTSPKFNLDFKLCQIIAYRPTLFQPADFESAIQDIPDRDAQNKKRALYLAGRLAMAMKDFEHAGKHLKALASLDFTYKDVSALLDKLAKLRDNPGSGGGNES